MHVAWCLCEFNVLFTPTSAADHSYLAGSLQSLFGCLDALALLSCFQQRCRRKRSVPLELGVSRKLERRVPQDLERLHPAPSRRVPQDLERLHPAPSGRVPQDLERLPQTARPMIGSLLRSWRRIDDDDDDDDDQHDDDLQFLVSAYQECKYGELMPTSLYFWFWRFYFLIFLEIAFLVFLVFLVSGRFRPVPAGSPILGIGLQCHFHDTCH